MKKEDIGRNEFEALVQRTKRISIRSPSYPESVGIGWANAELARLRSLEENNRALLEVVKRQEGEIERLRFLATRWYLADGSFEVLPEEEVIERRKKAAVVLAKVEEYERLETERVTGIRASDGDIVSLTREAKERLFEAVREGR